MTPATDFCVTVYLDRETRSIVKVYFSHYPQLLNAIDFIDMMLDIDTKTIKPDIQQYLPQTNEIYQLFYAKVQDGIILSDFYGDDSDVQTYGG